MSVELLRINQFRNIASLELPFSAGINLILGPNGAGKTSILEAIYVLARGRSFRSSDNRQQIRQGQRAFDLFLQTSQADSIGIRRSHTEIIVRCNNQPAGRLSDIAQLLPVFAITPKSHELVEGSPDIRRRFLDWGVFHVEQGYGDLVQSYNKILKQRNASLRESKGLERVWNEQLLRFAECITSARQAFLTKLQPILSQLMQELTRIDSVEIRLQPGWQGDLAGQLEAKAALDKERGFTSVGPHRAELSIQSHARGVRDAISRGQQKMLAIALLLAQTELLSLYGKRSPTLLIDDLPSELDADHLARILAYLERIKAQKILASIEKPPLISSQDVRMFHVEQGQLQH